jgi:regulator of protease activity HflC (stomatin/prohibitin superfamily)
MDYFTFRLIYLAIAIVIVALSVRFVPKGKRAVRYRLGKRAGLLGPGIVVRIPFVDRLVWIRLDDLDPSWRNLSGEEIERLVLSQAPEIRP